MSDGSNDYTQSDKMDAARLAKAKQLDKEIADAQKQNVDLLVKLESLKKEIKDKEIADAKKQLDDSLLQLESVKKEINQLKSKSKSKKSVRFALPPSPPSIKKNTAGTRKNKKRRHISKRYKRYKR
jgi:chromosome segregation ATPase